jgi:hypothetical protein
MAKKIVLTVVLEFDENVKSKDYAEVTENVARAIVHEADNGFGIAPGEYMTTKVVVSDVKGNLSTHYVEGMEWKMVVK